MWRSFDPRPSPNFSPWLRDKIWEWPGDEATQTPFKHGERSGNKIRSGLVLSVSTPCSLDWVNQVVLVSGKVFCACSATPLIMLGSRNFCWKLGLTMKRISTIVWCQSDCCPTNQIAVPPIRLLFHQSDCYSTNQIAVPPIKLLFHQSECSWSLLSITNLCGDRGLCY